MGCAGSIRLERFQGYERGQLLSALDAKRLGFGRHTLNAVWGAHNVVYARARELQETAAQSGRRVEPISSFGI